MGKTYEGKGGFRVELNPNQFVTAYPQGGGFSYKFTLETFLEEFKEVTGPPQYRAATFSIDGGEEYPGFHTGRRWNGWACPCFEHAVVLAIQKTWEGADANLAFDEPTKTWSISLDQDEPEVWEAGTITVDGVEKTVYHVGAGSWCWDATEIKGEI